MIPLEIIPFAFAMRCCRKIPKTLKADCQKMVLKELKCSYAHLRMQDLNIMKNICFK